MTSPPRSRRSTCPCALRKDERAGTTVDVVIGNAYTALVPEADVPAPAPRPKAETPMVARPCE